MKNKIVKILIAGLSATSLFVVSGLTSFASPSVVNQSKNGTGTYGVDVSLTVDDAVTITFPKTIELDTATRKASYKVTISGDSTHTYGVTVPSNFDLACAGRDNGSATVTQDKTTWTPTDIKNGVEANGEITAPVLGAGVWSGSFNFVVTKS